MVFFVLLHMTIINDSAKRLEIILLCIVLRILYPLTHWWTLRVFPQTDEWRVNEQVNREVQLSSCNFNLIFFWYLPSRRIMPSARICLLFTCDEWNKYVAYLYIFSEKYSALCSYLIGLSGFPFWKLYLFSCWWAHQIFWFWTLIECIISKYFLESQGLLFMLLIISLMVQNCFSIKPFVSVDWVWGTICTCNHC